MTAQETAHVAAIATLARSPVPARGLPFGRDLVTPPCYSDHHLVFAGTHKASLPVHDGAPKLKEIHLKGSSTVAKEKVKAANDPITGTGTNDVDDDLADIFISDEVLKQLRQHTDNKEKKSSKQRRKMAKAQNKIAKLTAANNLDESDMTVKIPGKKVMKPTLRSKRNLVTSKSQIIERTGSMEFRGKNRRDAKNKAANNNWMMNEVLPADTQIRLTTANVVIRSPSSYVGSLPLVSSSVCRVCCARNCTSRTCKCALQIVDPTTKEYSFKRADSSDDSGCFSNQSMQSINSPGSTKHEENNDPCPVNETSAIQHNYTLTTAKKSSNNSGLCSACGNQPQGNGSGLCKTCIGRIKRDGSRIGALGELRAYAQSIAESVKKILSRSPREDEEDIHHPFTKEGRDCNNKDKEKHENTTNVTNVPGGFLQKCKTQMAMTVGEDLRPKNFLNKSISFDGRAVSVMDENNRGSPMYWITQEKSKLPPPATTFCPSEEDKLLRCQENSSDHSVLEGDYFSSSAKELKMYTAQDDDKNAKTDKVDKLNKRNYTKQVSCVVDKVRTEGSSRGNSFQQASQEKKQESKKVYDLQRSRSRIPRTANADVDMYDKQPHKREDEIRALNVFRLKVIHEGSPVDPLYTVQKVKGGEDSKDRRAVLMRSATAPNKNHMPKKDNTAEDKLAMMKNAIKAKRSSTKLGIKTCSSPLFANEDSHKENEEEPKQIVYEPVPESWRDDASVMAVASFIKRRSTSYDCNKQILSKRSDPHKSVSRSAIERDATRNRQRKKTPSKNHTVASNNSRSDNGYSSKMWQPSRFPVCWAEESHADVSLPLAVRFNRDPAKENPRHHKLDFPDNLPTDRVTSVKDSTELLESPNTPAYFGDVPYHQHLTQPAQSPIVKELAYIGNQSVFRADSYYRDVDESSIDDGIDDGRDVDYDTALVDRRFKGREGEDTYHSQIEEYSPKHVSPEKESLWYSSHLDRKALMARDGSRESKSSTSFQIVKNVRSSHSDVALMKYQGTWEHPTSRRQSMYSETDVDTGLIYHFAKRQTTRAHVPPYHDLTSASKDIYTMSGDVSTSASSNSSISNKSEVSECEYTGGFYKRDPFYDNDSRLSSSSSSADTSSQLYFEPSIDTKREPSELDIYTGAVFSSSQNALSLGRSLHTAPASRPFEALQNGSTNNSTRPSRMSRRLRHRAHIDVIKFKSTDSVNEMISKRMEPNSELILCNISNNSCTWCHMDEPGEIGSQQGAVVKLSSEPLYTDYVAGTRPVFETYKVEKSEPVVDLLKYERQDKSGNSLFFTTPMDDSSTDSDWYQGFYKYKKIEPVSKHTTAKTQSCIECAYSWQYHDDYYTSGQRPWLDRSNNNNNNNKWNPREAAGDTNNNRLDDIYTGFVESPKPQRSPEQQSRSRKTSSDSWYADQPRRSHSAFYRDDQTPPGSAGRAFASDYQSAEGAYSSPSVFTQAREAYAGSSSYMSGTGWKQYDHNHSPPSSTYVDEDADDESPRPRHLTPGGYSSGDTYSYFPYGSNLNPADGGYLYDSESFDRRSPSPDQSDENEIKKVGGIVCRENVVNKEDYAEDVNRDLEQAVWTPYNFRHNEEKVRHSDEPNSSRSEPGSETQRAALASSGDKHGRHYDDSIYNQNRLYDSGGDRKKWRESASVKKKSVPAIKKESSPHRANSAGDSKKQDYVKSVAWNPPDQIPDKARGKRNLSSTPKAPISDGSKSGGTTSHVISSVTSLPSRLTNYVKKWL